MHGVIIFFSLIMQYEGDIGILAFIQIFYIQTRILQITLILGSNSFFQNDLESLKMSGNRWREVFVGTLNSCVNKRKAAKPNQPSCREQRQSEIIKLEFSRVSFFPIFCSCSMVARYSAKSASFILVKGRVFQGLVVL